MKNYELPDNYKQVRGCHAQHKSYLECLESAYNHHKKIVLNPDHIWYTALCEVASRIKSSPEIFKHLFTKSTSDSKTEISIPYDVDPELIDMAEISRRLVESTPTDSGIFLPEFTTSTPESQFAFRVAFADAMSPFYKYSMYCCKVPEVVLLGTSEDWSRLKRGVARLADLIGEQSWGVNFLTALAGLNDPSAKIFHTERCGSGSQQEVYGWFTSLFMKQPSFRLIQNFPTHISQIEYKNLSTGKEYLLQAGILTSTEEGELVKNPLTGDMTDRDVIHPKFNYVLLEKV